MRQKLFYIILTPMVAIICIILNGIEYDNSNNKISYKTAITAAELYGVDGKLHKIVNFIPSVVDAFVSAYPDFTSIPFDVLKTVLMFKYNMSCIITNTLINELIDEVLSQPAINKLFKGDEIFKMLIRSCAYNSLIKIIKQILKYNYRETAATANNDNAIISFHVQEGFDCSSVGGLGSKRWAKMVKKMK